MTPDILETEIKAALNTTFGIKSDLIKYPVSKDLDVSKEPLGVNYRSVAPHFGWYMINTGRQALVTDEAGVEAFNRVLTDQNVIHSIFLTNKERGYYSDGANQTLEDLLENK